MMKQQQQQQPAASSAAGPAVTVAVAGAGCEGEKKAPPINSELWHACAGPLVSLPPAGSLVVYFPQGHSEQIAASMQKDVDAHVPSYPNLPSKLICLLYNITLHADPDTDEVYAQMTLKPVTSESYGKEALQLSELALKQARPHNEFFCKTLTASDTSTHGGFSVPRRAAEKIFPPLDFSMQPPTQEIQARDLHDIVWTFRHIYRGQPKRHLLTTGWSLFVSSKRLFSGDSVIFVRDERQQLLLGIRRANRQPTNISSSVLSSDSMHIGILAAAAYAAANNSPFTIFYNPRASPTDFVVPFAKYQKAVYSNQLSLGLHFRMMFETEELGTRYMGTIIGINDLDPVRWKNSQWRNLQVGWDESAAGERRNRVSIWEIEPVTAPFFTCPPPFFGAKRPRQLRNLIDNMADASAEPPVMALDLLRRITNNFSTERKLGSGSYGTVYLGVYPDGKKIAVKLLTGTQGFDDKQFQDELKIMTRLRHQNIVRLVGYCNDIQKVPVKYEGQIVFAAEIHRALCLEYMAKGSLDRLISDECDRYDWHTCYQIIKGMWQGLNYLHNELEPPMYHFDLKPANILLDENMVPRIADFGMSRLFSDEHTRSTQTILGTLGYSPPEFIDGRKISNKFDIFSLGVIMIKMMAGRSGYSNSADMPSWKFINNVRENWTHRLQGGSIMTKAYSKQVNDCIEIGLKCVQKDRDKRPTIEVVVNKLNETETMFPQVSDAAGAGTTGQFYRTFDFF